MASSAPQGLLLQKDVLGEEHAQRILEWLDSQPWSNALSRRTQHYGYEYDYKEKTPNPTIPLSGPLLQVAEWLHENKIFPVIPNQCIVNEYTRQQGIATHTDALTFGPIIAGISLGDATVMEFTKGEEKYPVYLASRSLLVMTEESRYQWKHGISKNASYQDASGKKVVKGDKYRRISLTYRTVS